MTVAIYPVKDGEFTFTERHTSPINVAVPEGSELLPLRGFCRRFRTLLFVPSGHVRRGWTADEVIEAATSRRGHFRFV